MKPDTKGNQMKFCTPSQKSNVLVTAEMSRDSSNPPLAVRGNVKSKAGLLRHNAARNNKFLRRAIRYQGQFDEMQLTKKRS